MSIHSARLLTVLALTTVVASAAAPRAAQAPQDPALAPLLARAGVRGRVEASCRAVLRPRHAPEFAVAVRGDDGAGRYLMVQDDGRTHDLEPFTGKPDLSCYSVAEADRLNATIAKSDTLNGRVTAEWDGAVVCGFLEPTIAVCWQFAQEQDRFVRIGGWTT